MKVLMVNSLWPPTRQGGAERSVASLACALREEGADVVGLTLHPRGAEPQTHTGKVVSVANANLYWPFDGKPRPAAMKAAWHCLDNTNPLMRRQIADVVERVRPDVIHTNNLTGFGMDVWRVARRTGVPVVHTLRDYWLLCVRSSMFRDGANCASCCSQCGLLRPRAPVASSSVRAVIGVSSYVLERHLRARVFRSTPLRRVIQNPVVDPPEYQTRCGERSGNRIIGYLGRIEPEKGIEVLLEAWVLAGGPGSLRLAGSGASDYVAMLRRKYLRTDVEWVGYQDSQEFLDDVDLLVVPSTWQEPFGRVVLEAAAAGVPAVVTDAGGLPEAASLTGAHVVGAGDPASLARALVGPAPAVSRAWASRRQVAVKHLDLYEEVLRGGSGGMGKSGKVSPSR